MAILKARRLASDPRLTPRNLLYTLDDRLRSLIKTLSRIPGTDATKREIRALVEPILAPIADDLPFGPTTPWPGPEPGTGPVVVTEIKLTDEKEEKPRRPVQMKQADRDLREESAAALGNRTALNEQVGQLLKEGRLTF